MAVVRTWLFLVIQPIGRLHKRIDNSVVSLSSGLLRVKRDAAFTFFRFTFWVKFVGIVRTIVGASFDSFFFIATTDFATDSNKMGRMSSVEIVWIRMIPSFFITYEVAPNWMIVSFIGSLLSEQGFQQEKFLKKSKLKKGFSFIIYRLNLWFVL